MKGPLGQTFNAGQWVLIQGCCSAFEFFIQPSSLRDLRGRRTPLKGRMTHNTPTGRVLGYGGHSININLCGIIVAIEWTLHKNYFPRLRLGLIHVLVFPLVAVTSLCFQLFTCRALSAKIKKRNAFDSVSMSNRYQDTRYILRLSIHVLRRWNGIPLTRGIAGKYQNNNNYLLK